MLSLKEYYLVINSRNKIISDIIKMQTEHIFEARKMMLKDQPLESQEVYKQVY